MSPSTPKAKGTAADTASTFEEGPRVEDTAAAPEQQATGPSQWRWIGGYAAHFPDSTNSGLVPVVEDGGYITIDPNTDPVVQEWVDNGWMIDATGVVPPALLAAETETTETQEGGA